MSRMIDDKMCWLGQAIRARREAQRISQDKLALMIGSGQSYISRVESGKVALGMDKLIKIADALGTSVTSLIDF